MRSPQATLLRLFLSVLMVGFTFGSDTFGQTYQCDERIYVGMSETPPCTYSFNLSNSFVEEIHHVIDYELDFGDGYVLAASDFSIDDPIPNGTHGGLTWFWYKWVRHTYCGPGTYYPKIIIVYEDNNSPGVENTWECTLQPITMDATCACSPECDFTMTTSTNCSKASILFEGVNSATIYTHEYWFNNDLMHTSTSPDWTFDAENFDNCGNINVTYIVKDGQGNEICNVVKPLDLNKGLYIGNHNCSPTRISDLINAGLLPSDGENLDASCPIYVYGEIIVDVDYDFENVTMLFGAGAGLTIGDVTTGNSAELFLTGKTTLSASCNALWRGIRVYPNGILTTSEDPTIKDALYAVRPMDIPGWPGPANTPELNLEETNFNNNFIGILAIDGRFVLNDFSNNHFNGGAIWPIAEESCPSLVNNLSGANYPVGMTSYGGIFVDGNPWYSQSSTPGAQLVIPADATNNEFHNLSNGINVRNCSNIIRGCSFFNIDDTNGYPTDAGLGISSSDGGGFSFWVQNGVFEHVLHGINANAFVPNCHALIQNTQMTDVRDGISLNSSTWGGNFKTATIEGNTIETNWSPGQCNAIQIRDPNTLLSDYQILTNTITTTNSGSNGIWIVAAMGGIKGEIGAGTWNPTGNTIQLSQFSHGIKLEGATDMSIKLNKIEMLNGGRGMYVIDGNQLSFSCNSIAKDNGWAIGVDLEGADNFTLDHTTIKNTDQGMKFSMPCGTANTISQNILGGQMDVGLLYTDGAVVGPQAEQGNQWSGAYSSWGAKNEGNFTANLYTTFNGNSQTPPTIDPPFDWFNTTGAYVGVTACGIQSPIDIKTGLSTYEQAYITGQVSSNLVGVDWEIRKQILAKIKNDPSLTSNPQVLAFYDAANQADLKSMIQLEMDIHSLFEISPANQLQIDSLNNQVANLLDSLEILDAQLLDMPSDINMLIQYDEIQATLQEKQTSINNLWQDIFSERSIAADALLEQLSNMQPESLPHQNEVKVWKYYLDMQAKNIKMSDAAINDLLKIAGYCPEEGGRAVYFAMDLYSVITGKSLTVATCKSPQKRSANTSNTITSPLSIYPNPGKNHLIVQQPDNLELIIQIFDLTGKTMQKVNSKEKVTHLNTSNLPNGLYLIDVKSQDGQINTNLRWLKSE